MGREDAWRYKAFPHHQYLARMIICCRCSCVHAMSQTDNQSLFYHAISHDIHSCPLNLPLYLEPSSTACQYARQGSSSHFRAAFGLEGLDP